MACNVRQKISKPTWRWTARLMCFQDRQTWKTGKPTLLLTFFRKLISKKMAIYPSCLCFIRGKIRRSLIIVFFLHLYPAPKLNTNCVCAHLWSCQQIPEQQPKRYSPKQQQNVDCICCCLKKKSCDMQFMIEWFHQAETCPNKILESGTLWGPCFLVFSS